MIKRLRCLIKGHTITDFEVETDAAEGVVGRTFCRGHCDNCDRHLVWVEQQVAR